MRETQQMLRDWEAGVEAVISLWQTMNGWVYSGFEKTYARLGVAFDQYYYESNTYKLGKDVVEEGLQKGVFYRKDDGSVWIDLREDGLDEKLVLRGDGTSVYITQDIGTADLKFQQHGVDQSIYVVGNEQDYHFKVLFLIMKKLGRSFADGMHHLSYGMVDLPSGKMKSREGTVVDADDLIQEMVNEAEAKTKELGKTDGLSATELSHLYESLGLAALKFFILKVDPRKRMLFNPQESIDFQGDTGPFVQYTKSTLNPSSAADTVLSSFTSTPKFIMCKVTARYIAPLSINTYPNALASALAKVPLPQLLYPSTAIFIFCIFLATIKLQIGGDPVGYFACAFFLGKTRWINRQRELV